MWLKISFSWFPSPKYVYSDHQTLICLLASLIICHTCIFIGCKGCTKLLFRLSFKLSSSKSTFPKALLIWTPIKPSSTFFLFLIMTMHLLERWKKKHTYIWSGWTPNQLSRKHTLLPLKIFVAPFDKIKKMGKRCTVRILICKHSSTQAFRKGKTWNFISSNHTIIEVHKAGNFRSWKYYEKR